MVLWNSAWESEKLVTKQLLRETFAPALLNNGIKSKAGFRWLIENYQDKNIIYQDGCWVGFRNIILKIPEQKLTVIILSNRTDLGTERQRVSLAYQLAQRFL